MITVHVNVTHPDGEGDITDLTLPEETGLDEVRGLAIAEHGHLFVDGDVVDLTIEGHFVPFDSFTYKVEEVEEVEEPKSVLPSLQMDVTGEYIGNAYPEQAEYRIKIRPQQHIYHLTVEHASGARVGAAVLTDEHADGIIRMASTDHSLSGYEDDWKIPVGMDRGLYWVLQTDLPHHVSLDQNQIDEVAAWLRYATGEEVWDGGEDWEY